MAQLLVSLGGAASIDSLHQSSETPWGNSNFVAGCLVVAALVAMARSASLGRHRKYVVAVGLAAIGVALLALSRGAIIAACVGAVFFLWSKSAQRAPRRQRSPATASKRLDYNVIPRIFLRTLSVLIPVATFIALDRATELRAQLNDRVYANVDVRVTLFQLAWDEFLKNPLTGTGWASFRQASLDAVGESQTFAHNVVFSMLQIGGLLAVPYLVVLLVLMYRAMVCGGPYRAAVAAAIAVSMTQPFFESTVGTLIILPIVVLAGLPTERAPDKAHADKAHALVGES
jgi:O-antigen ligase